MDTEASRRFERGVDYAGVPRAQQRCVELICEIAGGSATENAVDVQKEIPEERLVRFRPARVEALTSLQVTLPDMFGILTRLGFRVAQGDGDSATLGDEAASATFVIPSWRIDVRQEEDLIEEVARHSGYDKIGSALPPATAAGEYQPSGLQVRALRRVLTTAGYSEAINFSFVDPVYDDEIASAPDQPSAAGALPHVELKNPITAESVRMRTSLLPGLLTALRHNFNHGKKDVCLFEIGRTFLSHVPNELPVERERLALLATGGMVEAERGQAARELDFFDLKGALEAGVAAMRLGPLRFGTGSEVHLRKGQTASIALSDGQEIGSMGRLSERLATLFKFRQPVYVAELNLTALLNTAQSAVHYQPLPRYPSVVRDVTLTVLRKTAVADLIRGANSHSLEEFRDVKLVGIYEGAKIPDDQRAVTLRIEYRADDRTLRDEEVEEMHEKTVDGLTRQFAVQ
jgi:phenylalanyl-tRNA synthetase beta chain